MSALLAPKHAPSRYLHKTDLQDAVRSEAQAMLTRGDINQGRARIVEAGGTPATFVVGPRFDSNWLTLAWHVSGHFAGTYLIGTGPTMDSAVTNLLDKAAAEAAVIRPEQLSMEIAA